MTDDGKISDEEIVEKVRTVDQDLYALIMARYQAKLLRYAGNLAKDEDKAADIVQAAFIKAFINLKGFNVKMKFSSWLYRIVHNEAINSMKKHQSETVLPPNIDFKSSEDMADDFDQKEMIARVERCLSELPLLYSESLTLRYIEEKSYEEISDILRIPMGTVATRINRAKKLMNSICQKK